MKVHGVFYKILFRHVHTPKPSFYCGVLDQQRTRDLFALMLFAWSYFLYKLNLKNPFDHDCLFYRLLWVLEKLNFAIHIVGEWKQLKVNKIDTKAPTRYCRLERKNFFHNLVLLRFMSFYFAQRVGSSAFKMTRIISIWHLSRKQRYCK